MAAGISGGHRFAFFNNFDQKLLILPGYVAYNMNNINVGGVSAVDRYMYQNLVSYSLRPEPQERAIEYLAEHLGKFLKPGEHVVLAFRRHEKGNISWLMEQAALRIDAVPVIWGPDHRWSTLLRQTFLTHASAVIGPPMVILGLMKLKRQNNTPLPIRKVVCTGYPSTQWIIDGIAKGLDCEVGGCFSLMESGVVAGFACGRIWGVHLRQEEYGVEILDSEGRVLPAGEKGQMVIFPKEDPGTRYSIGDRCRMETARCRCGSDTVRLMDMEQGNNVDPELYELSQRLMQWTSVLDCRVIRGPAGLEIELMVFPGEKLPKLPNAAKLEIRAFNPRTDEPFWFFPGEIPELG